MNIGRDTINLRKYALGDRVLGKRSGSAEYAGTLVGAYVTINKSKWGYVYRNPAYVILCDSDGKTRVYQGLQKLV